MTLIGCNMVVIQRMQDLLRIHVVTRELRSFRRGWKGQPPKEAEYFYHYFVQPLTFIVCVFCVFFCTIWFHFGLILGFGRYLESPWRPFVAHLWPRSPKNVILGSF